MSVKNILISQPEPKLDSSPYHQIIERQKVRIDFRPFIRVEPVSSRSIREEQVKLSDFTALILTSRNSVNHFFRIAEEMKYEIPDDLYYLCQSEAVAHYLQKYIVYRKRRIYVGEKTFEDMTPLLKKFCNEHFFFPSSDVLNEDVPRMMNRLKLNWYRAVLYKTVHSNLKGLLNKPYDIIVLFTPSGVEALFSNFPNFEQKNTKIAAFGKATVNVATKAGLKVNIMAPQDETPSMSMALEKYIIESKKR
ncbi:uroporphyrinogen-III synthase [Elysia marginata]|uniref:Uroporphyrinogen-III synthase n=1 Tax=Elysia marginata TaxID=1093978 RepID=A0AAV4GWV2_9GAST|nr:uroporphyrinogen-III synthase [Elysia marginata]